MRTEIIEPTAPHTHTVILLHGRGSDAFSFRMEFFESQVCDGRFLYQIFPSYKWILPSAESLPSRRFGLDLTQWFDMWSTESPLELSDDDEIQLLQSAAAIEPLLEEEVAAVGADHVLLGGISQGCVVALFALLGQPRRLGGFVGFSSWLPAAGTLAELAREAAGARQTPVFLAHCVDDRVIGFHYGGDLRDGLQRLGLPVEWHAYPSGGHWVNEPQGIEDLVDFVQACRRRETAPEQVAEP